MITKAEQRAIDKGDYRAFVRATMRRDRVNAMRGLFLLQCEIDEVPANPQPTLGDVQSQLNRIESLLVPRKRRKSR